MLKKVAINQTLFVATLMLVGELVFLLPFVVARIFRPTFLKVFDITNFELGTAFSVYGVVAMLSYFLGGPIADRFPPRKLLPVAILATSCGGLLMATIPNLFTLTLLYAFWGTTTILLFWSSYVKAQREIGGKNGQGRAFGAIDAGRGFVAAAIASLAVFLLDGYLPADAATATNDQLAGSLSKIILLFSGITAFSALMIWLFPPADASTNNSYQRLSFDGVKKALKYRSIWLQAIIILCSYVAYKCTDDFSLYAQDAFGYDDVEAAHVATISFWVRPIAAIAAGLLGDHFMHSKISVACFGIILLCSVAIAFGWLAPGLRTWIVLTIITISAGIYGLRGIYYALFQEANIPLIITGSAAGVVSVVGYTPDVFFGPLMGWILDRSPGVQGHQHLFGLLILFSIIGLLASLAFQNHSREATKLPAK